MSNYTWEKLGNYRLVRLLGLGGFAEVHLGEHIYLKTPAAIKVLHVRLVNDAWTSFLTEARTIARLEHPHIVRVLEFGVEGSTPYLVMNYAPNGTVRRRYPKGSILPLSEIVAYVKQISEALQYAHNHKIIHRDVKPENILLDKNDDALLSDFGLAVVAMSTRGRRAYGKAGTTVYMAPEQIQGKPVPASDQYALGVIVYEWLCGRPPFTGSDQEIANHHLHSSPPSLREKVPTIPFSIEQVVMKALSKDPQQRYSRVQLFAQALEQAYQSYKSSLRSSPGMISSAAQSVSSNSFSSPSPLVENSPSISPVHSGSNSDLAPILSESPFTSKGAILEGNAKSSSVSEPVRPTTRPSAHPSLEEFPTQPLPSSLVLDIEESMTYFPTQPLPVPLQRNQERQTASVDNLLPLSSSEAPVPGPVKPISSLFPDLQVPFPTASSVSRSSFATELMSDKEDPIAQIPFPPPAQMSPLLPISQPEIPSITPSLTAPPLSINTVERPTPSRRLPIRSIFIIICVLLLLALGIWWLITNQETQQIPSGNVSHQITGIAATATGEAQDNTPQGGTANIQPTNGDQKGTVTAKGTQPKGGSTSTPTTGTTTILTPGSATTSTPTQSQTPAPTSDLSVTIIRAYTENNQVIVETSTQPNASLILHVSASNKSYVTAAQNADSTGYARLVWNFPNNGILKGKKTIDVFVTATNDRGQNATSATETLSS